MSVYVDTSAFYAFLDRDDRYHSSARKEWETARSLDRSLVTNSWVMVECFALIQRRLGMDALRAFHDDLLAVVEVVQVDSEVQESATQAVLAANRRSLSLVDCSSFQVMRSLGLRHAFTFDRHFREQGFDVVPSPSIESESS